jgi:hypothetical protein
VDAIYRACIDTCRVLRSDAGFCDYVRHFLLFVFLSSSLPNL